MKYLKITGGKKLSGNINISGAKNSVVALIPAAILCEEEVVISNVPNITDVDSLEEIMKFLGCDIIRKEKEFIVDSSFMKNKYIPNDISQKLRASYYFMGALLSRFNKVEIAFPGGCSIGQRPIDLHLEGFEKLGAKVIYEEDKFLITATKLIGADIELSFPSVGATINLILASVKAIGTTKIKNAAKEPEVENLILMLNQMGANISGFGTDEITIIGVNLLKKCQIKVIPDRIEAGTYLILGALLGNDLKINNIEPNHLNSLIDKLLESGNKMEINSDNIIISAQSDLKAVNVITNVYPGFATDFQQPFVTYLTKCVGTSIVEETIYENRFLNVKYLNQMGANIIIKNQKLEIIGKTNFVGKKVVATDLRGGASVVLAGLLAIDETIVYDIEHILRGYDDLIFKLSSIGANIELIEEMAN